LTALLEYGLAALDVAAQVEGGQKTPDHFVALVIRAGADQLNGALLEGWIRVLPQGHDLHQGQIATLDGASFHCAEQPAGAVGALEQNFHYLVANCGCQRRPATEESGSEAGRREPIERRQSGQLNRLPFLG